MSEQQTNTNTTHQAEDTQPSNRELAGRIAAHLKGSMSLDGGNLVIPVEAVDGIFKEKLVGVSKNQLVKAQEAELLIEAGFRQAVVESAHSYMGQDAELTKVSGRMHVGRDELSAVVRRPTFEDGSMKDRGISHRRTTTDDGLFGEIQAELDAYALTTFGGRKD